MNKEGLVFEIHKDGKINMRQENVPRDRCQIQADAIASELGKLENITNNNDFVEDVHDVTLVDRKI